MAEYRKACGECQMAFVARSPKALYCGNKCKMSRQRRVSPPSEAQRAAAALRASEWAKNNPERHREIRVGIHKRRWIKIVNDPALLAKAREQNRRAYKKNPALFKAAAQARKAKIRGAAVDGPVRAEFLRRLEKMQQGKCAICRGALSGLGKHVDHVVPLAKGGAHSTKNLQLLCPACNRSKSDKLPEEFMRERGFLC